MEATFVYDCIRTPRAKARSSGSLYEVAPMQLVATLLRALEERYSPEICRPISDLILGCVTPVADQGYNIAQAALLAADWPAKVAAVQINRFCASGLESVHQGYARISAGLDRALLAGGLESMSRVPLGSDGGPILEDPQLMLDHLLIPQGVSADLIATRLGLDRESLDAWALRSQQRAAKAQAEGYFDRSIVPVKDASGLMLLDRDEYLRPETQLESLAALRPAFAKTGLHGFDEMALARYPELANIRHVHTAGNSSGLVDGAALCLLGDAGFGESTGLKPRAKIRSVAISSSEPTIMLLGMIPATELALKRAGMGIQDIDLIEVNEAFAAVPLAFMEAFEANEERINVNGGAIALGHPVGATGSMLLGTLLDELERRNLSTGLVTLCAGGGQGIALILERC